MKLHLEPDPVIDAYKGGVDITLVRKSLSLSVQQRVDRLQAKLYRPGIALQAAAKEFRDAGRKLRAIRKTS